MTYTDCICQEKNVEENLPVFKMAKINQYDYSETT